MNSDMLRLFLEENFSGKNLVVVSNREPYIHKKVGTQIKVDRPAGGLTSALDDVLRAAGGIWVAWGSGSRDKDVVDNKSCIPVPPGNPSYTLKRVWLSPGIAENYYHGYANQVLWPLCHITLDRVYFRKRFWEDYKKANRIFAKAVLEESSDDSIVWIHDYHLCLLPGFLRDCKSDLTIAHFWHIPWPDWGVFRVCPQAKEILEGLLGNDLLGFQIPLFAKSFMDCVKECLDADLDYQNAVVTYKGHATRLKAFPISIDYQKFHAMATSRRAVNAIKRIKQKHRLDQGYIGIGVDRLEYTKALIKRLQAIDLFFERYARYRGRVTFIQIAVPTRTKEPYLSYQKAVGELIARINGKHATTDWKPVVYIDKKVEHQELVAYYRMADIGIISSVYDGMNLVAKEYVASQADGHGVLILSELAGAAEELEGALLVNPYDVEGFSDLIYKALKMPHTEKASRMAVLRQQVRANDIYKWIADILHEIVNICWMKSATGRYLFDNLDRIPVKNTFLFLDYDGTLSPIVESPDKAFIPGEIRDILLRLKKHMPIAIISGRALEDIKERVGIEDIIYAGNHGAEIWNGRRQVVRRHSAGDRDRLEELLRRLREDLMPIQGVMVEDKGITASIHFRKVSPKDMGAFFDAFRETVRGYEDTFRITAGKKVFEIRPLKAWNKGKAVSWIMEKFGKRKMPIYVGDDTTDEDAFKAIKGRGVSICVGGNPEADYYLKRQEEVGEFLEQLTGLSKISSFANL
ncbi:MAG: bifunctional alpha,alpha-trehalose-phosphate synthase (UDP-forming)/trehalose-phosphatase [Thermodesulfobacteriota bacterium]|nr:bifunctional alpha,alpha-trehalose-phosphate synthase (UDP-forming)/trehalose-phosphatase [Thermodesulfobacteriota bacterium]